MPNKVFSAVILLAATLFADALRASDIEYDFGAVRLLQIADGVYAVSPTFTGSSGVLIVRDSGNFVVDTHGSPASAQALIDANRLLSKQPIRFVLNTHWHVDHHSGNTAYREAFGDEVTFISHDKTRRDIPTLGAEQFEQVTQYRKMPVEASNKMLREKQDEHGAPLTTERIVAIKEFRDRQETFAAEDNYRYSLAELTYSETLTLHDEINTAEIFFLHPAHTESDSIVYLRDQEILIVGDVLTKPILWSWSSYPSAYISTLRALEQLPVRRIVIGHGGPVLGDNSYLIQAREFLEAAVNLATVSHSAGQTAEDAKMAAKSNAAIESFRRQFVGANNDPMFDQMVAWTIDRAYLEF